MIFTTSFSCFNSAIAPEHLYVSLIQPMLKLTLESEQNKEEKRVPNFVK